MVRLNLYRGVYGVFVYQEEGVGHHRPHAHICRRGQRLVSIFLDTGTPYDEVERLPRGLLDEILSEQEALLARWEELNA
jgi:hypothetical protein